MLLGTGSLNRPDASTPPCRAGSPFSPGADVAHRWHRNFAMLMTGATATVTLSSWSSSRSRPCEWISWEIQVRHDRLKLACRSD